jgi:type IV secretory pathway VirJ component
LKRILIFFLFTTLGCQLNLLAQSNEVLEFGRFGQIHVYGNTTSPEEVVLFVSGDGGWNLGVIDMAKSLASLDAMVIGIDITHYLPELEKSPEKCAYPASDFEMLSKYVQKNYNLSDYIIPILVGYSSGATLVYATLVQAPSTTFKGAISLGFCPDLPITKPFCPGSGLTFDKLPDGKGLSFLPAKDLDSHWIVLQGDIDQVCDASKTKSFSEETKGTKFVLLKKVGHGFSVQKNWMPQFKQAFSDLSSGETKPEEKGESTRIRDLPLIEVPAKESTGDFLAIHLTGDGGWGVTDKGIAQELANNGIPVVGLNSLKYFWKDRTPEETSRDVQQIITHYLTLWKKDKIILIGYSFGADVLPFVINLFPDEMKSKIKLVVFLGPSRSAEFQFHLTDWLGGNSSGKSYPVQPELEKLYGYKMLCFYGKDDKDAICKNLNSSYVKSIMLPGGHRIGHKFDSIVRDIMEEVGSK